MRLLSRVTVLCAALLPAAALSGAGGAAGTNPIAVTDPQGAAGRVGAPVSCAVTLTAGQLRAARQGRLCLREGRGGALLPAQFEVGAAGGRSGRLWWILPPGPSGRRSFSLVEAPRATGPALRAARDPGSGQIDLREGPRPVLRYIYRTVEPGAVLNAVAEANRIYARARSDYIHPLYGLAGEELTKDWSVDHPHHRGIYWAWPEVDFGGERGDLHALQRVLARPTGRVRTQGGPVYAQVEAENLWRWEDREPIVREWATLRAYRSGPEGRLLDLTLRFEALGPDVALARRETRLYGGLNVRLSAVAGQRITFRTDPLTRASETTAAARARPRMAWADLSGTFPQGRGPSGLAILQSRANPEYPGDWIQYPELNWFQPTFPTADTRYVLRKGRPLVLRYRLWIHPGGTPAERACRDQWLAYNGTGERREWP